MANTRISDLTASASNLASTDLAPVVQTVGVGPVKMTGLQLAGGLLGSTTFNGATSVGTALSTVAITGTGGQFSCAAATLAVGQNVTISGTLGGTGSITGYSSPTTYTISATNGSTTFTLVNASTGAALTTTAGTPTGLTYVVTSPVVNFTQTWNNSNVTFTGLKFNATDTASAAASLLLDLQVGGGSAVNFRKNGTLTINGTFTTTLSGTQLDLGGGRLVLDTATGIGLAKNFKLGWSVTSFTAGYDTTLGIVLDVGTLLISPANATTQLGAADAAAPAAQTFKVQSGTAGASATTVSISGTSLTIAGTVTGTIAIGHAVTGTGVSAGTLITAGSGTSWTVNNSQTVGPITAYFNSVGADFTIRGSQGSGPSAGGSIIFQVAPAGSAATTAQNAYATALTINSAKTAAFQGAITTTGSISTDTYVLFSQQLISAAGGFGSVRINSSGLKIASDGRLGFTNSTDSNDPLDTILARDAANTLALRNGTSAQIFRAYSTTTGPSYGYFASGVTDAGVATADTLFIGTGGAGAAMTKLALVVNGTTRADYGVTNSATFTFNSRVNVSQSTQCYVSFTAGGVTNYFGTAGATDDVVTGSAAGDAYIRANNKNMLFSTDNGATAALRLNSSGLLQFGGTTSSFPALKRSSARLQVTDATGAFGQNTGVDTANVAYQGVTFANLPTAAAGIVAYVTDASNAGAAFGDSVTAGGSTNKYLVWYNGTNWTVIGK